MKILAINGSRRKHGNTGILLQTVLHAAAQTGDNTEIIHLGEYDLNACTGCEGCSNSWKCVIKDDFATIIEKIDQADAIVLGSPTYWYTVTSDMKRFIDRCYSLIQFPHSRQQWISKYQGSEKACVTVAVCEQHDQAMMGNTLTLLSDFCRDIGLELVDSVAAMRCFEAGSVIQKADAMRSATHAGETLARALSR